METARQTDAPSPNTHGKQSTIDALAALERFIVDNDDLLELESRIGKFNIFDALGIARRELQHSNFLAFILDPAESHGQGQIFLKALLMDLLKAAPADERPLSPIDLDGIDLRGVEVEREWEHIDLLITCKEPRFVVVIENKIDSQDHSKQLDRYSKAVEHRFPDLKPLYVYLTPEGDDPTEETTRTWLPYRYETIHRVLKRMRDTAQTAIGDDVLVFLDHYLHLLGTRFMQNDPLNELCRRIYKNHRQALELIWDRVGSPSARILDEVEAQLRASDRWHVFHRAGNWVTFVPKEWLELLKGLEKEPDDDALHCEIFTGGNSLVFCLVVGQMANKSKRKEILDKLFSNTVQLGFRPRRSATVKDKLTRAFGQESFAPWKEEEELTPDLVRSAVQQKLDEVYPKLSLIPAVLKPLCYDVKAVT